MKVRFKKKKKKKKKKTILSKQEFSVKESIHFFSAHVFFFCFFFLFFFVFFLFFFLRTGFSN